MTPPSCSGCATNSSKPSWPRSVVTAVGVVGYAIIGRGQYSLLDALYMTLITLTTVGLGR